MAIDRLRPGQSSTPPKIREPATPASSLVAPTTTRAETPKVRDAVAPPVQAKPASRDEKIGGAASTAVKGDWLGGEQNGLAAFRAALRSYGVPAADTTSPPAAAKVHRAALGSASLISPSTAQFDPRASAADNLARLKAEGVPRFPELSAAERAHEAAFASSVQADPAHFVEGAMLLARNDKLDTSIFEVDAMKRMYEPYGTDSKPADAAERELRGTMNHALHPTAVTVARLAFLTKLDELGKLPADSPKRQVFITNGGCGAGKGSLTDVVKQQLGDIPFGAVWDAAGEGDALENGWILQACEARGLKTVFGFVDNNPLQKYGDVLSRGESSGRIVDVATFTNSYIEGAKNMKSFLASPEYQAAVAAGTTTTFGIYTGRFDPASLTDKTKPAFPELRLLGKEGLIGPNDVPRPASKDAVLAECVRVTTDALAKKQAEGQPADVLLTGALGAAQKFLATWEDA